MKTKEPAKKEPGSRRLLPIDMSMLGEGVAEALQAEADRRGHTITAMVRQCLRTVVLDGFKGVP